MVVGELAHERDLIIIGGGPGGYHAAIRAAQLGQSVTLIEKDQWGGVCLNKGCIPSKIITHGAEKFASIRESENIGIESKNVTFNMNTFTEYKHKTIKKLRESVQLLCTANKVEMIKGAAFFLSENKVGVENGDQYNVYRFKHAIIATGSSPQAPEGIKVDNKRILDSWSITSLDLIPENLFVYGSDYIALEMSMAFEALGSQVTLILDNSKDDFDYDLSINRELKRVFKKNQIQVIRNASISKAYSDEKAVTIILQNRNRIETITGTHLFTSSFAKPNIENIGMDRIGIETTESGFIKVNKQCQTTCSNIFAIGDVTEGPVLAVKAMKQGKVAAEAIAGIGAEADFRFIPAVAHTRPPIASAGLTEQEAFAHGYEVEIGQFPLSNNGYAGLIGKKDGFIKVIFDKKSKLLLGMHMIGDGAIELISSGILSLEMIARDEDLLFPLYPHPSINEALLEAVEALKNQAIHLTPNLKKERFNV
ncbi:dihydrolipoyl dehydrogenase [Bacillus sp. FJAT-29790]|uniref:dihydrolipoyl dehydrogenase n=1 Tax=Bacillus sp. FJAT-29790 TaxID=1895002 RepID=UPI001C24EC35|nr:dihydrolipoyl dehydrogenase [Bacillus sp. FJAT-29790]MBU8878654.1 dihydrolipoyl dehydrogenase [Bacillus sp. FJAT-29790]